MGGSQSSSIDEKILKYLSNLKAELEALREYLRRTKDFKDHLQTARQCLLQCKKGGRRVVVLLGVQGAGKSTLAHYLFEMKDAAPVESRTLGTTEHVPRYSSILRAEIIDTIGSVLAVKETMHVLACIYNQGWTPEGLIVVYTGRHQYIEGLASQLGGVEVNTVDFSPKPFWKQVNHGVDVDAALADNIFTEESLTEDFSHLHALRLGGRDDGFIPLVNCQITEGLLTTLDGLNWQSIPPESNKESYLSWYMFKCISERSKFRGSDQDFLSTYGKKLRIHVLSHVLLA